MRAWKNNKGFIAWIVVVIGVVTLRCTLSWAQTQVAPPAGLPGGPLGSPPEPQVMDKMPQRPMPTAVDRTLQPPVQNVDGDSAFKDAPASMQPGMQTGLPPAPAPLPGQPPVPPGKMNDAALAPTGGMPSAAPPQGLPGGGPGMPPPQAAAPPLGLPGTKRPPQFDDMAEPPAKRVAPGSRRPGDRGMPPSRIREDRVGRGAQNKNKASNPNEADIFKVVPQTCVPAKGQFTWNFEDEELMAILRQVSDLLCKTIVVNDSIGKNLKMTIIGKSMLTPKDAWDVLMASLASKGLALIEQGKTWTVVKRGESKSYATPMYFNGKQARPNEEIGTLFYRAQHASQDSLKNIARLLISKDGMVDAIGEQFIIIIDSNSNIRRLDAIFAQVDVEDAINKVHVINLAHADAKTVEKQLRELFDVTAGPSRAPRRRGGPSESKSNLAVDKIIADERTNSLIIISDKESLDKLNEVVALIDQPAADQTNKGKIHVKKLRFADAKKIAETLNNVVQQGKGSRYGRRREEATGEIFEGEVKVTAHENTNTLVTVASANDYRSLLATINSLDVRKEQVYVEAVILDIQVNDENDFGINLFGGIDPKLLGGSLGMVANPGGVGIAKGIQGSLAAGAAGTNITSLGAEHGIGALAVLGNFLSGGVAAVSGPKIKGTEVPSFGAVLQAISKNTQVDVLSTPYLLTTDNQEAEMAVGEKVPVVRGTSMAGSGGIGAALGVPLQNVAYEDVKLTFKITPHVGADDNVRLDIHQEVNELGPQEDILNQKQYRIRTKSAKTQLVLKDQQTGVIGGLISHTSKNADNKVPLLGDIPILGWLFKNRHSSADRKNLLLIITPYIIRTDDDYKKIVDRKLKEREEFAAMYYGGKIKNYNKFIDYDKKAGPLSSMLLHVNTEMNKSENGGTGGGTDTVIKPKDGAGDSKSSEPRSGSETSPMSSDETVLFNDRPPLEEDFMMDDFDSGPGSDAGFDTGP